MEVGGVWNQSAPPCHSPAYDSLFTNSSHTTLNFSDFPYPSTSSVFPTHAEMKSFYTSYMDHFGLQKHIKFNHKVVSVSKVDTTWEVTVTPPNKTNEVYFFDAILICTGKLWHPKYPDWTANIPTENKIDILHSKEYRNPDRFKGRNVVVVGVGNSALDISLELAQSNAIRSVSVSCRSPTTIVPIKDYFGFPNDVKLTNRFFQYYLSPNLRKLLFYYLLKSTNSEFQKFGLSKPDSTTQFSTGQLSNLKQTEDYLNVLKRGRVQFVKDIDEIDFKRGKISFKGGVVQEVDAIICCTGYSTNLDFLEESLRREILKQIAHVGTNRRVEYLRLFKNIVFPNDPTLCFLGMVTSFGNEACVGEMQARWVTALWRNELQRPLLSSRGMNDECDKTESQIAEKRIPITAFVRYIIYLDDLGADLGSVPALSVGTYLGSWAGLKLYLRLLFDPVGPVQYRLHGKDALLKHENFLFNSRL